MARPKKVQPIEGEAVDEIKEEIVADNGQQPVTEQGEEVEIEVKPKKRLVCPGDKTGKFQLVTFGKPVLIADPDGGDELVAIDSEVEDGYVCVTCHRLMELADLEEQDVPDFAA